MAAVTENRSYTFTVVRPTLPKGVDVKSVFVLAAAMILASGSVASAKNGALFEVCVDPATAIFTNGFNPGSVLTASGVIVPVGTIPAGGAEADCSDVADARIGTFFVRGNIVGGLPTAEANDLAYVSWEFRVDNVGTIETTGIVKTTSPYLQPIAAATGSYHSLQDRQVRTNVLDTGGFQFRETVAGK
jgi:hypothetical protein